ncbi:MAG TPA: hypothetical protein VHB53_03675 [Solirubrobacterales bacterium]|nr:hypothetical protein [Solirubrobacterales bacterium]
MIPVKSHGDEDVVLAAWTLPLIVAAIAVAIVGGFYVGGPGLGLAVGALAATTVVVLAARAAPRGPIVPAPLSDLRRHVLLVSRSPLEDPRAVEEIAQLCASADPWSEASEVRLLVPTSGRLLDRWSGERRRTLEAAQRRCVLSLAALTKAGLTARADIGDEDVVLAVEDELRTYPATDVILVTGGDERAEAARIAAELRARLQADFLHLEPIGGRVVGAAAGERRKYRFTS